MIARAGIEVYNNMFLSGPFDALRKEVPDVREAVLRTRAQRLRPVMLTTVTTILGLIPMVLQINIDFLAREATVGAPSTQWWVSLSNAIVFGLGFATVLTLVVTPAGLMLREHVRRGRAE